MAMGKRITEKSVPGRISQPMTSAQCKEETYRSLYSVRRRHRPVVGEFGLHVVAPGLNPVLTSGLDFFPVSPDSTLCK